MARETNTRPWLRGTTWGGFDSTASLPNVAGATIQDPNLNIGDLATIGSDLYICTSNLELAATWEKIARTSQITTPTSAVSGVSGTLATATTAVPAGVAGVAVAAIAQPATSGHFTIEHPGTFTANQIINNACVVVPAGGVIQGRGVMGDETEMDIIDCTGQVVNSKQLRVRWAARGLIRGNYRFVYQVFG